ncbi:MAG: hypothetical protein JWO54_826 [Candidatus Saccharibacteria bacterium]|nr:hypothetical protein [Candidatus Saccharibacteria bacterium]
MTPERLSTGNISLSLSNGNLVGMTTSRDKVEEIWAQLEYYTMIPENTEIFLRSKGITANIKIQKISKELTAYIQQAKNFFTYAQNSDYRSSPLLYYYSFLNLAKAKIIIEHPEYAGKKFKHGMYRKIESGKLARRTLGVRKTRPSLKSIEVFNELYNIKYGSFLPEEKSLNIKDLMGYVSDVSQEYTRIFGKTSKISGVKYYLMYDSQRRKSWTTLAIHNAGKFNNYRSTFKDFFDDFEPVDISSLTRNTTFGISGFMTPWYSFYQSKTEYDFIGTDGLSIWSHDYQLKNLIGKYFQYSVYDQTNGFEMLEPLNSTRRVPMDETLSIYACMYYISEIVRYDPESLNSFLSDKTKDGWILKSFIESSSSTFLIRMASWIIGDDHVLETR